jgi:two-component system, NarL family, nitrate/nitrite response regulator NarL
MIRIALYTEQPFVARGLAEVLARQEDLHLSACTGTQPSAIACVRSMGPDILLIHPIAGISLEDLRAIRSANQRCQTILWGQELGGEFGFQAMQLGVRGIVPANIAIDDLLTTLRNVHRGVLCFDQSLVESMLSQPQVTLSPREGQLVSLVAQGLKNKEIAFQLGLTEGTVKGYLHKLFKKLGMNDRLDMALFGLKNLFGGQASLARMKDTTGTAPLFLVARRPPPVISAAASGPWRTWGTSTFSACEKYVP